MRELLAIIRKDLRVARRDPRFLGPSLIVPFVLLSVYVILWSSFGGGEAFTCGLVVQDDTVYGEEMAEIIEGMRSSTNHTWFSITRYDLTEAENHFLSGDLIAYIVIPSGFGANISSENDAQLIMYVNNINDDIVKNYVHRIEAAVLLYNQGALSPDFDQSEAMVSLEEYHSLALTPGNTEYAGAAAIILSLITCTLAGQGMNTAADYENKAIEDTLNSPVSRVVLMLGHSLSAVPRSLFVLVISFPIVSIILNISPVGNPVLLLAVLILSALALTPLGELIGILTKEKEKALLASVLLTIIGFLAGGGLAPVSLMPIQFRMVALMIPVTHVIILWTRLFYFDTTLGLVSSSLALVVFWLLFTAAVVFVTKKEVER
ncbi:MAG: ABC transporter permease [Candidatus Thorarchaeota archaeon]